MFSSKSWSLLAVCMGVSSVALLWSAIYVALPSIRLDLHASQLQAQWVVNIYGVLITSTLAMFGRMADRWGYRRVFVGGVCLVLLAILGSALSQNVVQLIICQGLFGLSAGILLPVSQALISNIYPPELRGAAIGTWGMVVGLAMAIGPFVGGALVSLGSWRTLFTVGCIFPVLSLILLWIFCPKVSSKANQKRLDFLGVILLGVTIALFIIGIDDISQLSMWQDCLVFGLSVVLLLVLLWVEKRAESPILCPRLWADRRFFLSSVASFCAIGTVWGVFYMAPHYMQNILHYTPGQSGLFILGVTIPLALCSMLGGALFHRLQAKLPMMMGFVLMLLSFFSQFYWAEQAYGWLIILSMILFGLGWGLIWAPSTMIAISTLGPQESGLASGSLVTMQEMGGTIGLAITATTMRHSKLLLLGFHAALWVLIVLAVLGLLASAALPKNRP